MGIESRGNEGADAEVVNDLLRGSELEVMEGAELSEQAGR